MTCNVVFKVCYFHLVWLSWGIFRQQWLFPKYITSPLTLPDGRNEEAGYSVGKHRITKEVLSLYPDLWVSRLFIGLLFSLRSHSSAHPAFVEDVGAWRKMFEASPGPTCPPRRPGHVSLHTCGLCETLDQSVLLWEARTSLPSLHPRERPHSPQLHPCSSYPCSGLSSGLRSL